MLKFRAWNLAALVSSILLVASAPLLAQTSPGTVKGVVVDKDGSPLPGATVTLENRAIGIVGLGGVTNPQGEFRITPVTPGKGYALRVSLPGYQKIEFTLEVYAGKTVVQNVTLREEFKERIRVEGKEEAVNTESTQISTTITSEFISGLPILGTDYQDVLTLAPGVTDVNETGNPNIHGARDTDVVTLVDGVSTTDPFDGRFGQNLNTESIEEIEVITAGAGAQYGRAQGGFVNIVTKSGGNEFKGSFSLQMRTYKLDGDGAGVDQAELRGGLGETDGFRDLAFNTIYPVLALSGAIVKDHLFYFVSPQYNKEEFPVNAGTQAFIQTLTDARLTAKLTWPVNPNNKLTLSVLYDDLSLDNQGLASRIALESGWTDERGGPTITLAHKAIFSPNFSLDSTISRFDQTVSQIPTTDPDTNGNGLLTIDQFPGLGGNEDGFVQLREVDPGADFDQDGKFDVFEDFDRNGILQRCNPDPTTGQIPPNCVPEDRDMDGRLTGTLGCEGDSREDFNCNGTLDFESDFDQDGIVDPNEDLGIRCTTSANCPDGVIPGTDGNGIFDTEDRNGNRSLDDTPFPNWSDANGNQIPEVGEFTAPTAADKQYVLNFNSLRISGPYFLTYEDSRTRDSLREDASYFIADMFGSHDLNMGMSLEKEGYDAVFTRRPFWQVTIGGQNTNTGQIGGVISSFLPTIQQATNSAGSDNFALYFGDTYKPIPNLTVGLVLRYDREEITSHGFTYFDPVQERREFDSLQLLSGSEEGGDSNNDGIVVKALDQGDPLYNGQSTPGQGYANRAATLTSDLVLASGGRLTRHNFLTQIESDQIPNAGDILNKGTPRAAQDFTISNDNLSPRISLSWDPWADGKSKATASWGRYYDKLFLSSVVREEGPDFLAQYYRYDSDGVDAAGLPDNKVGRVISKSPPSATQVDRALRTPFSDQFILGFQREIAPEMTVGLTYVSVKYRDQLQDYDVNHSSRKPGVGGATCNPDNVTQSGYCDDFGAVIRQPPQGSGGEAGGGQPDVRVSDRYPDLFINNPNFNQIFRIGNINYQEYVGYELTFVRRLSRKWQMNASYVFSKSTGQADNFLAESGDDPALTELKSGYLEYDQRHVATFSATSFLPGDWRVGTIIRWASGLPYSFVNRFTAADNVDFPQTRRLFGQRDVNSGEFYEETRNSHRNAAVYDIGVRTEKRFVMGKVNASAFFAIDNLLNTDDLRVFEIDDRATALQSNEIRDFGRRYQFGIRMDF